MAYGAADLGILAALVLTDGPPDFRFLPLLPIMICTIHPVFAVMSLPPLLFSIFYSARRWPWWFAAGITVYWAGALAWLMTKLAEGGL